MVCFLHGHLLAIRLGYALFNKEVNISFLWMHDKNHPKPLMSTWFCRSEANVLPPAINMSTKLSSDPHQAPSASSGRICSLGLSTKALFLHPLSVGYCPLVLTVACGPSPLPWGLNPGPCNCKQASKCSTARATPPAQASRLLCFQPLIPLCLQLQNTLSFVFHFHSTPPHTHFLFSFRNF